MQLDTTSVTSDTSFVPKTVPPGVNKANSAQLLIETPATGVKSPLTPTNTEDHRKALVKNDFFTTSYSSLNDIIYNVDHVIKRIEPVTFEPPSYLDESLVKPLEPYDPEVSQNTDTVVTKSFFVHIRDGLVNYQISQNIPSDVYTFISLVTTLSTLGCKAIHTIFIMIMALFPMIEILIHVSRFLIDHLLDILNTDNRQEKFRKSLIFMVEIGLILCLVIFIFGSVLLPLWSLGVLIVYKIMCFFTV
ncbi:hypothetical protein WDU94_012784 [Cyamophila willieti]